MPRTVEKDRLSRDTASRIRKFCFKNLKAFYNRYIAHRGVTYYYFLRAMGYHEMNKEIIDIIEACARELHIVATDTFTGDKETVEGIFLRVRSLLDLIDRTFDSSLSYTGLKEIKERCDEIRPMIS